MNSDVREAKPTWAQVPSAVKRQVEARLGVRVRRAVRTYGGYGPSATFMLHLEKREPAFFKGTYPLPEGSGVRWALDAEEKVYRQLSSVISPWAPAYLGSVGGEGWRGLLLEAVDGDRVPPWSVATAKRAARSYAQFHCSTLGMTLPRWLPRRQHLEFARYWSTMRDDSAAIASLARLSGSAGREATTWLRTHIGRLAQAERLLARAAGPAALLHFDTRSDNIRVQADLLRIFDWPFACVGPPEFDLAAFAQSIESESGPAGEDVIEWYAAVMPVRRDVLIGAAAGVAGYFADRAPRPEVQDLPRLRSVQRRQLKASLALAARMLALPTPAWLHAIPS